MPVVGQPRSTQRREPRVAEDDAALRARCARSRGAAAVGVSPRASASARSGWSVNRKRVQRLWREEGLRVPPKRRKRQRLGESTVPGDRLRAERPDQVWAFSVRPDRRRARGEAALRRRRVHPRSARDAGRAPHRRRPDRRRARPARPPTRRPRFVRCDNGPELTAHALRDWCRFSRTGAAFIEPGSPWQNPFVESFNGRVRDELLAVEVSPASPRPA